MRPQCPPQPHSDPPSPTKIPPSASLGGVGGNQARGCWGCEQPASLPRSHPPPNPSGPLEVATPPFPPRLPPRARFPVPWRPILGPGAPGAVRCGREALRTQQPGGAGASLAAAASAPAPAPSIPARPRFGPMEPPPVGAAVTAERWPGVRGAGGGGGPRWVVVQGGGTPRTLIHGCARGSPHTPRKGSPVGGDGGWGAPEGPPRSLLTPWRWHPAGRGGGGGDVRPSGSRGVPGVVLAQPRAVPGVWVKVQRLGMNPRSVGGFQGWRVFLAKKRGVGRGSECRVSQLCWG